MPAMRDNILVGMDTPRPPKQIVIPPAMFVKRVWLVGDELSTPLTTVTVPATANFCVATAIGCGGDVRFSSGTFPSPPMVGGGGCYTKSYFPVNPLDSLTTTVYPHVYPGDNLGTTVVHLGETVVYAPNGFRQYYQGSALLGGAAGNASVAIGDVKYSGTTGVVTQVSGVYHPVGGNSGNDSSFDILNIYGLGSDFIANTNAVKFGGGASIGPQSSLPFGGGLPNQAQASGGILILEYYTSDPRVDGVYS